MKSAQGWLLALVLGLPLIACMVGAVYESAAAWWKRNGDRRSLAQRIDGGLDDATDVYAEDFPERRIACTADFADIVAGLSYLDSLDKQLAGLYPAPGETS